MAYRVFSCALPENQHSQQHGQEIRAFSPFCELRGGACGADSERLPPPPSGGRMRLTGSHLACIRGGRAVFRDLNFAVAAGEILAVTGPNGAGKSSLLRLVAGLVHTTAGRFELSGGDPELSIAEQAHYLGHQDAIKPALTVRENLAYWSVF